MEVKMSIITEKIEDKLLSALKLLDESMFLITDSEDEELHNWYNPLSDCKKRIKKVLNDRFDMCARPKYEKH